MFQPPEEEAALIAPFDWASIANVAGLKWTLVGDQRMPSEKSIGGKSDQTSSIKLATV